MHAPRPNVGFTVAVVLGLALAAGTVAGCTTTEATSPEATATTAVSSACPSPNWVASWGAAPSDASFPQDATFTPLPAQFRNQTVRNVITPHLASTGQVRLHLTNRYNAEPVTFERVTIGVSRPDGGVEAPVAVLFGGSPSVTAAPGQDVVSDPAAISFDAFEPLAVSIYLPSAGAVTKHWNSNATTFITAVDGGDQTTTTSGEAYPQRVHSWLGVLALDVQAGPDARAVVAFGDSITDGWVGASATETKLDLTVADQNLRYPDDLQRRLAEAGTPISVVNAGISGNMIVAGVGPMGPSGLERFASDVSAVAGARGVIIFEGINDLGLSQTPAADVINGLDQLTTQARAAGLEVWLATITPASDSMVDGVASAPNSDRDRQVINEWIRTQADVDGVFDFDEAVRDPANPAILAAQYASPDRLHLSPAGYEKLAATVDLDAIAQATC